MYKVVIADDEKIIRMGLKNVVNWNELGFEVAELFSDGQEVIEYLDYAMPDVILSDVKMNHVSGLEVAKYVFENQLPCKVVLVSGYREFELAVQGIKYGAEDYLLKPTEVDAIETTFAKIKKELDMRQSQQADRERMEEAIPILEERFFADLVMGVVDSDAYVRSCMSVLYPDIRAEKAGCFLADIYIDDYEDFMEHVWQYSYDQLETNVKNFFRIYKKEYRFHLVYKMNHLLEVVGIQAGKTGSLDGDLAEQGMKQLTRELEQNFRFHSHFTVRRLYSSIYEIIRLKESGWSTSQDQTALDERLQEQKMLVMSNITMGNIVTAQKLFHTILEELEAFPAAARNNKVIDILSTMNAVIQEINEQLSRSLQSYFNYSAVLSMRHGGEVRDYCDRIFDRIRMADDKKEYYDTDSLINKAKTFIQANIYKDISQEETAAQLYICPSYLSRLFKKQTGESFTQYVTRTKMEKAVELLKDPRYKTYQVSEMLGYKTPRYFARLFRAQMGMNPSEYRGKVLHVGGEFDEN